MSASSKMGMGGRARLQRVERRQIELRQYSLDQLITEDDPARAVWAYVESLDLAVFYAKIRAVEGGPGRDPIDPKILMALWLFATIDGVGSSRRLEKLCESQFPYMWLCGGVSVNYHTLSDFRSCSAEELNQLLTQGVAALLHAGLVELNRVAQDGMRVRASAGAGSFRRQQKLEQCLKDAEAQLAALKEEADSEENDSHGNGGAEARRVQAARERSARERAERIQQALVARDEVAKKMEVRKKGSGGEARASTTDPDARKMKMGDGGFRPAYNVQFATTADSRVIVGVEVVQAGTDGGLLVPMTDQIEMRYGERPQEMLADGGFVKLEDITRLESQGTQVYLPIMEIEEKRRKGIDPYARVKGDTDEVAGWRARMGTPEAQEIYKERAASAEFANAGCRNRGLHQFRVRGLNKVLSVTLWHALAHNFQRMLNLSQAKMGVT
jgi:transposase